MDRKELLDAMKRNPQKGRTDVPCEKCRGTGIVLVNPAPFGFNPGNRMDERTCPKCNGRGKINP